MGYVVYAGLLGFQDAEKGDTEVKEAEAEARCLSIASHHLVVTLPGRAPKSQIHAASVSIG